MISCEIGWYNSYSAYILFGINALAKILTTQTSIGINGWINDNQNHVNWIHHLWIFCIATSMAVLVHDGDAANGRMVLR